MHVNLQTEGAVWEWGRVPPANKKFVWREGGRIIVLNLRNCARCIKKMNQWEPIELSQNTVTMYSIQEHIASIHGLLTDVTPTPLHFFKHIHAQKDTQLQQAVNLIITSQILSYDLSMSC